VAAYESARKGISNLQTQSRDDDIYCPGLGTWFLRCRVELVLSPSPPPQQLHRCPLVSGFFCHRRGAIRYHRTHQHYISPSDVGSIAFFVHSMAKSDICRPHVGSISTQSDCRAQRSIQDGRQFRHPSASHWRLEDPARPTSMRMMYCT